jgi:transcriptional regulator with XRE-family HTH domain
MHATISGFGSTLRRLRSRSTYSQSELAARAGLAVQAVQALEQGQRRNPTAATILALARGLGIPPAKLLDGLSLE